MQAQEIRCLTAEQIDTTLNNLAEIQHISNLHKIFDGRPVFSRENEKKYMLIHISKIAENYKVYDSDSGFGVVVISDTHFDKLHILAVSWFEHLFTDEKKSYSLVYISPAYVITQAMMAHVPEGIFRDIRYRFVPLPSIYPMIGSNAGLYGMTSNYRISTSSSSPTAYNNRAYPKIAYDDPIVAILRADHGDLIECKRVVCDSIPYEEIVVRRVV